jgi:hypothetical protein
MLRFGRCHHSNEPPPDSCFIPLIQLPLNLDYYKGNRFEIQTDLCNIQHSPASLFGLSGFYSLLYDGRFFLGIILEDELAVDSGLGFSFSCFKHFLFHQQETFFSVGKRGLAGFGLLFGRKDNLKGQV